MKTEKPGRRKVAAVVGAVLVVGAVTLSASATSRSSKSCTVNAGASVATIQAAVNVCQVTNLAAGTYALTGHIVLSHTNETIDGAGAGSTLLVQHARTNIFQIEAPGVTVENLSVDTAQFNPGVPPVLKDPVPSTIFSAQSRTSIINVNSTAGTGFGFRLTGPNPCSSHTVSGDVVRNVSSTNTGTGGFTALDMDCLSSGTATNVTIHGDYLAAYQSSGLIINGLTVTPGPYEKSCGAPLYITGPADGDSATNVVSHGGKIITQGAVTHFTQSNVTISPSCQGK